jgi:DNA-binding LacI/PurR family transcriptional regulator
METGLTADIELCDTSEEGGYRAGLRLLDRPTAERATAVFAASDLMRSASCRPRPNSTTPYWPASG